MNLFFHQAYWNFTIWRRPWLTQQLLGLNSTTPFYKNADFLWMFMAKIKELWFQIGLMNNRSQGYRYLDHNVQCTLYVKITVTNFQSFNIWLFTLYSLFVLHFMGQKYYQPCKKSKQKFKDKNSIMNLIFHKKFVTLNKIDEQKK